MPEISATFVVEPYDITINTSTSNINVTPQTIDMNISAAGFAAPGGNNGELQYNQAGLIGGVPIAVYTNGNLQLSNVANFKLPGGSNAYFLQTDGTGNLVWAAGTINANTGNGIPVGANTQIQITDGTGNFVSAPGFTFNYATNVFTAPGNATISGNITTGNANLGNAASANYFLGDGGLLSNILSNGANFANYANFAGQVTNASQPNITNVGNLTQLTVLGDITGVNVFANLTQGNYLQGTLTANSNYQPNINSIGNLNSLTVLGNALIVSLRTTDTEVYLGLDAGDISQGAGAVAVGADAGRVSQGVQSVAIGYSAGENAQANYSVAVGRFAGYDSQGSNSVAIGANAGANFQHNNTIILNATGVNVTSTTANSSYIKPLRQINTNDVMFYESNTGEITYANINAVNISKISNGTSFANIPLANSNINFTVGNTTNAVVFANSSVNVSVNANITGNSIILGPSAGTGTTVVNGFLNVIGNGTLPFGRVQAVQFQSTVANGTAPIVVTSTTQVANLNSATAGTVRTNAQPNITSVGTLSSLTLAGNITSANVINCNILQSTYVYGDGSNLINIPGGAFIANGTSNVDIIGNGNITMGVATVSNVFVLSTNALTLAGNVTANLGNLARANYVQGTLTTNAQPNITSVGTLTGLNVNGNITAANITANTGVITGNGSGISALNASNITTGTLAQARLANSNVILGNTTVTLGTTVTTITGMNSITSNTFIGALNGNCTTAQTVTNNAQPNITSIGQLTNLYLYEANGLIHLGSNSNAYSNQGNHSIAIGTNAGNANLTANSIAIGIQAGLGTIAPSDEGFVAIGANAGNGIGAAGVTIGKTSRAGNFSIGIGQAAYANAANSIAIGRDSRAPNINSVAIGFGANTNSNHSVAIGSNARTDTQTGICIGNGIAKNNIILNTDPGTAITANVGGTHINPISATTGYSAYEPNLEFKLLSYSNSTGSNSAYAVAKISNIYYYSNTDTLYSNNIATNTTLTIPTYASNAARDSAITSPTNGMLVGITGTNSLQCYLSGAWRAF